MIIRFYLVLFSNFSFLLKFELNKLTNFRDDRIDKTDSDNKVPLKIFYEKIQRNKRCALIYLYNILIFLYFTLLDNF